MNDATPLPTVSSPIRRLGKAGLDAMCYRFGSHLAPRGSRMSCKSTRPPSQAYTSHVTNTMFVSPSTMHAGTRTGVLRVSIPDARLSPCALVRGELRIKRVTFTLWTKAHSCCYKSCCKERRSFIHLLNSPETPMPLLGLERDGGGA